MINNVTDLKVRIALLQARKEEQEYTLKQHFSSPSAIIKTLFLPASKTANLTNAIFNPGELIGLISRFVLPFALNRTIFKHSNFIIKALVGLVSQKASGYINPENIASLWDSVKMAGSRLIAKKRRLILNLPIN